MRKKEPVHVGFNMTPMIDIVFNLIVFFMLVSEFTKVELAKLEPPGPSPESVEAPRDKELLLVNITAPGEGTRGEITCRGRRFTLDGTPLDGVPGGFADMLQQMRATYQDIGVQLRGDRRLKWIDVVDRVMSECARVGIDQLYIVAVK
jgi:biopolymer transport protein ExbD